MSAGFLAADAATARARITLLEPGLQVAAVAAGASGDVAVTGMLLQPDGGNSLYVARYSPSGTRQWRSVLTGGDFQYPAGGRAIAIDSSGDVFVTGSAPYNGHRAAFVVARFAGSTGDLLWTSGVETEVNGQEIDGGSGGALRVDSQGNVSAGGTVSVGDASYAAAARLVADTGAPVWTWSAGAGEVRALDEDAQGNVAITGPFLAAKLSGGNGQELWRVTASPSAKGRTGSPVMHSVAVDGAGNVWVAGTLRNKQAGTRALYSVKLSGGSGAVAAEYAGPAGEDLEGAAKLTLDPSGIPYAVGRFRGVPSVLRLRPDASLAWTRRAWSGDDDSDTSPGVGDAIADSRTVYASGMPGGGHFKVAAFAKSGGQRWTQDLGKGTGVAVALAPGDRLYAVGQLAQTNGELPRSVLAAFLASSGAAPKAAKH